MGLSPERPDAAGWDLMLHRGRPGFRRSTLIEPASGVVRAEIEDDFHNFWLELHHDGVRILNVVTGAPRHPWESCIDAGPFMATRLTGALLAEASKFDAQLTHCTHLYDLALLAAAHAHDSKPVLFQAFIADEADGLVRAELYRDQVLILAWNLIDGVIQPPDPNAGESLRRLKFWLPHRPAAEHEPATYLRRVVFVSGGRKSTILDARRNAASLPGQAGACYTFAPERAANSFFVPSSRTDFTQADAPPLAGRFRDRG